MSIGELYEDSVSLIFIRWTDTDRVERFTQYQGKDPEREVTRIRARRMPDYGYVIVADAVN